MEAVSSPAFPVVELTAVSVVPVDIGELDLALRAWDLVVTMKLT